MSAIKSFVLVPSVEDEVSLLKMIKPESEENLLRKVFENSKKFASSAKWYYGAEWEVSDFYEVISKSEMSCFRGRWNSFQEGISLERECCELANKTRPFICHYYKEAMDGLVLGLTDEVIYRRYENCSGRDGICKDVFLYSDAKDLKFAPIPDYLLHELEQVKIKLLEIGVSVDFPGQLEGEIFYQWKVVDKKSCEDLSKKVKQVIEQNISQFEINIKDITPKAIIGPGSVIPKSKAGETKWNQIIT